MSTTSSPSMLSSSLPTAFMTTDASLVELKDSLIHFTSNVSKETVKLRHRCNPRLQQQQSDDDGKINNKKSLSILK